MAIVDTLIDKGYNVYPHQLAFNYFNEPVPKDINNYDYVFVHSDFGFPIKGYKGVQLLTGAELTYTYSYCDVVCSDTPMPLLEYTNVPTVGFVGRIPVFNQNGQNVLHRGFEPRYESYMKLLQSNSICFDGHARFEPTGNSAGFWGDPTSQLKSFEPMFKINMLANQYALTARGNGNYAQRFYEACAYGRIPVYVYSGGKLPWDDFINYKDLDCFVWVDNISSIEQNILEFHETHDLHKCQNSCRS